MRHIQPGSRLPRVRLAELVDGEMRVCETSALFKEKRSAIVGIPGVFSPVCSRVHLPQFVTLAPAMLASGFDLVVCIAPDDPWSLSAGARQIDPQGHLRFLSDGNLDFGRACRLTSKQPDLFMGECLDRFSMIVVDGVVEKISVETSILEVTCSAAETLVAAAGKRPESLHRI